MSNKTRYWASAAPTGVLGFLVASGSYLWFSQLALTGSAVLNAALFGLAFMATGYVTLLGLVLAFLALGRFLESKQRKHEGWK